MAEINKKSLEHIANLARLELSEKESEKFLTDLGKILGHFEELQEVNTDNIQPMTGGTELKNMFREDGETKSSLNPDLVVEAFPEKDGSASSPHGKHWLKVPAVFDQ